MLRAATSLDFTDAIIIKNKAEPLTLLCDNGIILGTDSKLMQESTGNALYIYVGTNGGGTGSITLTDAFITNNGALTSIKTGIGDVTATRVTINQAGQVEIFTTNGDIFANWLKIPSSQGTMTIQTERGKIRLHSANLSTSLDSIHEIIVTSSSNGNVEMPSAYLHAYKGRILLTSRSYIEGTGMMAVSKNGYIEMRVEENLYLNASNIQVPKDNSNPNFRCFGKEDGSPIGVLYVQDLKLTTNGVTPSKGIAYFLDMQPSAGPSPGTITLV